MNEPTGSRRDAASTIFNLPDYRVIDAVDLPEGGRRVLIESTYPPGCPGCGVVAEKVHSRRLQRLRDIPVAGATEVWWVKRRWFCAEEICGRGTFAEATDQVPRFARSTQRLKDTVVAAVIDSGRAAAEVARAHGVSWWLVQTALTAAAAIVLPDVDDITVTRLGIDEHRYRSVRWFRNETGAWRRFEPWMTTLVDLATGQVLGVVDGRDSRAVGTWLKDRSSAWRNRVEVVAIDPSAAFRKALREHLPEAAVSVDKFHLVKLGNDMLTRVRQRLAREQHGRRGRKADASWAHRTLLLRGADTLTDRAWARLEKVFRTDDPTDELSAAWAVKEQLRRLLGADTLAQAWDERMRLGHYVMVANTPETTALYDTVAAWWEAIEVLLVTGATTARVEAANTGIKNIKRTARGFRNSANYKARILLTSAARAAA
ncbi:MULTISPECIES: ISL3 family transposase [Micrococcus]|uniref:ISL3 family transposase n=1 Tax=Micrococcus luteus TaxID=1270 RepID=UPI0019D22184|nr:ISL3 family transposase [Micrococcus luteus]MBN6769096.1 ISL3 family transposase [Micrococcus luteus]MBN6829289.1 ISL3 family transposase [Micrococcus luteus]MBN6846911.1 ISL3 family transposase [Micrococcus luteus]MBN6863394.1 ISL3 family transposase [Micrococcus luteus]MBN6865626.1 ISL3 family transposase [Micrococcus luteus]